MTMTRGNSDDLILGSSDYVLRNHKGLWSKNESQRAAITLSCKDSDYIPKVRDAGKTKMIKGIETQIMHNGVYVKKNAYQGGWQTKVIQGLKGVHEPQEEKVFYEVLKRLPDGGVILELGAWWAYYSLWFLKEIKNSQAICCEPDSSNFEDGKTNVFLNNFNDRVKFYNTAAGEANGKQITFENTEGSGKKNRVTIRSVDSLIAENNIGHLDILHVDVQGAELAALAGALNSIKAGLIRFIFVSTHHYAISGDPATHEKCLEFIEKNNGTIISKHAIAESCSGDGLIVASFDPKDRDFKVDVSVVHSEDSLFRTPEEDVILLSNTHNQLVKAYRELENKHSLETQDSNKKIANLQRRIEEITPLRRHIKKQSKYWANRFVSNIWSR